MNPPSRKAPARAPRWLVPMIIGAALLAVCFQLLLPRLLPKQPRARELPPRGTIEADVELTDRTGKRARMLDLRGKVVACAYLYTVCPHGCAAVAGEMRKLLEKYGGRPDFHLVSMAVLPDHDTADMLNGYAEGLGLKPSDPWWFLTGERAEIWNFMDRQLRLTPAVPIPEEDRLNALDTHDHDLRIVLIDRRSRIRGYYAVFHPQAEVAEMMCEALRRDTGALLDEP